MILYALMYCMGVSLHLSQICMHKQMEPIELCSTVYYIANKYDEDFSGKYDRDYLASLKIEYPLYMGAICMGGDNSLTSYYLAPEAVFHHNWLKWELEEIKEDGGFASPLPLLEESVGSEPTPPGVKAVMRVYRAEYNKNHPRYLEAFKLYLERFRSLIIIREDKNAPPDILWRPTFKYGTYNPYAPNKEQYEYYEGKNATDLVVRDW